MGQVNSQSVGNQNGHQTVALEPEAEGPLAERSTHAFYLNTEAEQAFATVHMPAGERATTGVLMCPSFGWDDMCVHRTKRTWAEQLSDAGYPTLRFDLPGTGDSGGDPCAPDRLRAWVSATAAAADWLRTEAGCTRVVGFGIGFGGMLAWLAVTRGAAIDDLMLWAVPASGSRLLREIRAAAGLSIDSEFLTTDEQVDDDDPRALQAEGGLVDESGQLVSKETIDSLWEIDLMQTPLPSAAQRRVLIFMRNANDADTKLRDFFTTAGSNVTEGDGDGYGAMMQYVQHSRVPLEALSDSLAWLQAAPPDSGATHADPTASPRRLHTETLELTHDGVTIRERPFEAQIRGTTIRGVITEPVTVEQGAVCAMFFSGGSDRRLGPNRMWVDTARRWATLGVPSLRADPPGIGDSDGDASFWDKLRAHYDPNHIRDAIALMDAVEQQIGGPRRFVLSGFCSGANRSFQVALADDRVDGVFAIAMPFFFWSWWTVHIRDWWVADWVPTSVDRWKKTTAVRIIQRTLLILTMARRIVLMATRRRPNRTEMALRRLSDRGTVFTLVFKPDSHELNELVAESRLDRLDSMPGIEVLRIPGRDMRFRPLMLQNFVNRTLDRGLARVLSCDVPTGPRAEQPMNSRARSPELA